MYVLCVSAAVAHSCRTPFWNPALGRAPATAASDVSRQTGPASTPEPPDHPLLARW